MKGLRRILKCNIYNVLFVGPGSLHSVKDSPDRGFSWGFIELEDLKGRLEADHLTISGDFVGEADEKGDRCFAILREGRLVHYSWYSTVSTRVIGNSLIEYPEGWVYMYNAFTLPGYRGMGMYPTAVTQALNHLQSDGFDKCIALVNMDNPSSSVPLMKIGFSEIGKILVMAKGSSLIYTTNSCLNNGVKLVREA